MRKINTFNWSQGFENIFKKGGFNIVLGNPPYLSTKRGFAESPKVNKYLKDNYKTAVGQFDAYMLFIEKALKLSNENGQWAFIIPKPILTNQNMEAVRKIILKIGTVTNIADFGSPFRDANVEAVVICHSKEKINSLTQIDIWEMNTIDKEHKFSELKRTFQINQEIFLTSPFFSFVINTNDKIQNMLSKIEKDTIKFKDLTNIFMRGVECGKKDESIRNKKGTSKEIRKLLRGEDISKYSTSFNNQFIKVNSQEKSKFKDTLVYETDKKIIIRRVGADLQATIDTEKYWNLNTVYNIHLKNGISYEYVLGLFNSKLFQFWFRNKFVFEDKLFPYARVSQLEQLPFKMLDVSDKIQKQQFDDFVVLVQNMLEAHKRLNEVKTLSEQNIYKNMIKSLDFDINIFVFSLYNLTPEEIEIIDGK